MAPVVRKDELEEKLRVKLEIGGRIVDQVVEKREALGDLMKINAEIKKDIEKINRQIKQEFSIGFIPEIIKKRTAKDDILKKLRNNEQHIKDSELTILCLEKEKAQIDQEIRSLIYAIAQYGQVVEIWKYR